MSRKAVNVIAEAIERYVKEYAKSIQCDVTRFGIVKESLGDGKYTVTIQGSDYPVPCSTGQGFKPGDKVLVLLVGNDFNKRYIIGKG